ncbi:MAG: peptide chain release factor N(5)-glutamine methyltransferase [Clostridiales bacterium]|nr:peptide chain release factor N(5)-glutamine methyltransferase [Clostridiales bacterium]
MAKTYNDIYMEAKGRFKAAGIGEYSLEARLLLAHLADKTPAEFLRDLRLYVSEEYAEKSGEMIKRRSDGEPIAYLTGYWVFYGLPLKITNDVLIPRTDTEIVVDTAIRLGGLRSGGEKKALRILDLCCGSGCIGLALAKNIPEARLTLTDNSKPAVKLSGSNAVLNKLASRVSCLCCDVFDTPPAILGTFDLIVSNPPYIKTDELESL